ERDRLGSERGEVPLMRFLGCLTPALLSALHLSAQPPSGDSLPSKEAVRAAVLTRISDGRIPGMAVGRISGAEVLRWTEGKRNAGKPDPVTPSTVFEIGSITKVFTGLLLADMVLRGEVALDDPVSRYLPAGTAVPELDGS